VPETSAKNQQKMKQTKENILSQLYFKPPQRAAQHLTGRSEQ